MYCLVVKLGRQTDTDSIDVQFDHLNFRVVLDTKKSMTSRGRDLQDFGSSSSSSV